MTKFYYYTDDYDNSSYRGTYDGFPEEIAEDVNPQDEMVRDGDEVVIEDGLEFDNGEQDGFDNEGEDGLGLAFFTHERIILLLDVYKKFEAKFRQPRRQPYQLWRLVRSN